MSDRGRFYYQTTIKKALLESIALGSSNETSIDITPLIVSYQFTESINSYNYYGKLIINDGVGLMNNDTFTITGEEFVTIEIETGEEDTDRNIFKYRYVVTGIDLEIKNDSGDSATIILNLMSVDGFQNLFTFKSRGYSNKTITNIVKDILASELNTTESVDDANFYPSTDNRTFAFTKIRPFEKIDILRQQAYTDTPYLSSTFMFFENRKGYNFKPLEILINEAKANSAPLVYSYSQLASSVGFVYPNQRFIRTLVPTSRSHNYTRLTSGFYRTTVDRFDFLQKRITSERFDAYKDFKKYGNFTQAPQQQLQYSLNVSELFAERVARASDYSYLIPWNSESNDYTYKHYVFSGPYVQLLLENSLDIVIDGTLLIEVGDPLVIKITDNRSTSDITTSDDKRYSGTYMVMSVSHSINVNDGGDYTHTCSLNLVRDLVPIPQQYYDQQVQGSINIPILASER